MPACARPSSSVPPSTDGWPRPTAARGTGGNGALPVRAGLGHGPRGLQRARHGLGLLPPRPRPVPGLPVERGRHGRRLRRPADLLLRARAVERRGPDPQGADVRPRRRQGNHGEDAKEYWWYLDSTPTHSWMRWRYHYPQAAFPYGELVAGERGRGRDEPEYELVDTGIFDDDRYWAVDGRLRQGRPRPTCACWITVENRGPERRRLHVLPTLWFRNTWSWGLPGRGDRSRLIHAQGATLVAEHRMLGRVLLDRRRRARTPLFCDNETNARAAVGQARPLAVPQGRHQRPRGARRRHGQPGPGWAPRRRCTTCSTCRAGGQREIRLRLTQSDTPPGGDRTATCRPRRRASTRCSRDRPAEADAFFAGPDPPARHRRGDAWSSGRRSPG